MNNPYTTLLTEMAAALDHSQQLLMGNRNATHPLADRARALMDQQQQEGVTDDELLAMRSWSSHGPTFDSDLVDFARAVIARYSCPTPQPPAAGEVAKLVALVASLRDEIDANRRWDEYHDGTQQAIIAKLLQHPQPVAVSERLPEPSVKVLAHYFNALGKGRTICAIWVPAKSRSDEGDLDVDDFLEYDEENDKYHWPEGWYEAIENWEELGWAKVYEGEIAYWQPLPHWPANALPTP